MKDSSKVELSEVSDLLHLLQHAHGDEEPTNPKKCINCEVSSRSQRAQPRSCQYIECLSPIFDEHEVEPGVVAEDNPKDRNHSHPIQEEQVLVFHCSWNSDDLLDIVIETKALHHLHYDGVTVGESADQRASDSHPHQKDQ